MCHVPPTSTAFSILWPTLNEVIIPSDITKAEVCRFIEAWPEKRQDSLIKQHLLVWHPDRSSHYLSRVSPALRNDVQEACRSVTQILVGIMDDRRAKAEQ
ncbi:hypothetical protein CPC08DRAFT_748370 [Agrocybe pediades]|nr:hypothetical protein CPC08DRAFT_748370 [Agrocybe pediades]